MSLALIKTSQRSPACLIARLPAPARGLVATRPNDSGDLKCLLLSRPSSARQTNKDLPRPDFNRTFTSTCRAWCVEKRKWLAGDDRCWIGLYEGTREICTQAFGNIVASFRQNWLAVLIIMSISCEHMDCAMVQQPQRDLSGSISPETGNSGRGDLD